VGLCVFILSVCSYKCLTRQNTPWYMGGCFVLCVQVQVFDDDTLSDDFMGEREIDLSKQYFSEVLDGTQWVQSVMIDLMKDGKVAGMYIYSPSRTHAHAH